MDPAAEQWARVRTLLGEALELDAPAQVLFVDAIEDPILRAEVQAYLAWLPADGEDDDPLDHLPWAFPHVPLTVKEGSRLGSYRLLKELGSGGMGTVYLAERDDREFEQRVAIKLIQHRLRSEEIVSLFRRERQILAKLDHPSIARLMDGGVTEDGRPFFVMEYVDGVPIDAWCELHKLSIRQRLQLFLPVCAAVQSAHQSLVVHRDLKPANILVTAEGIPKLLDFGVAKLLDEQAGHTATIAMLTPRYASPEHARGEPAATATDIYSLGVLLFEMLTGCLPLAGDGESLPAFLRALQEDVPRRPSDVGSNLAQQRELRGDLDNIILHVLEKLPARRYSSVESFAADIQRYLDGFPIFARPASWGYRAGKFIRRRRGFVAAAVVLAVVAGVSVAAVARSAGIADRQHALAELRSDQGRELVRFYILEVDRLLEQLPGSTRARSLITSHSLAYLDRLTPGATGDVALLREFATAYERVAMSQGMPIYANMGDRLGALANVEKGIRIRRQILASPAATPDDRIAYGDILLLLGHLNLSGGNPAAAMDVYLQATHEFETVRARSDHPAARLLGRLSSAYLFSGAVSAGDGSNPDTGDAEAALPLFEKAVGLVPLERKAREGQAPAMHKYLSSNEALMEMYWAGALTQLLRTGEADAHYRAALRLIHSPGIDSGNAEIARKEGLIEVRYSNALIERGELDSASPHLASSTRIVGRLLKTDPENVAAQTDELFLTAVQGRLDIASGRYSTGFAELDRAIAGEERMLARDRDFAEVRSYLARHYLWAADGRLATGQPARARYSQAVELAADTAQQHPDDANAQTILAAAELGLARSFAVESEKESAARHRKLAATSARAVLAKHPGHPRALALLAQALGAQ